MIRKTSILFLLALVAIASAIVEPCLNGCSCERDIPNPVIRCDFLKLDHFPLPIARPYKSYNFLALTCNKIETVPDYDLVMKAFPDLHGIDFQGNYNLNCSSLQQFSGKLAILSDCDAQPSACTPPEVVKVIYPTTPAPFKETAQEQPRCDRTCKNLIRLNNLWTDVKNGRIDKLASNAGKALKKIFGGF